MRVFLAGASGVIGQRLIPRLLDAGHVVGGMTRSPEKVEMLGDLGAEPVLCDVFDREGFIQAVCDFKPDVVVNELTDLPDDVTRIGELAELNARVRTEGRRMSSRPRGGVGRRRSLRTASPGSCLTGPAPTTSSNSPTALGCTSTEPPTSPWRPWASQRRRHRRLSAA